MDNKGDMDCLFPAAGINASLFETVGSFDPQMPLGRAAGSGSFSTAGGKIMPPGVICMDNGVVRFQLLAAGAQCAEMEFCRKRYPLQRVEDEDLPQGMWRLDIVPEAWQRGYNWITFYVDGAEIINPVAPVCYGASRPINYAEIPDPDNTFYHLKDVPHGTVSERFYYSKTTELWKNCMVYTPPGYDQNPNMDYPVLYLQHGHGENETCWIHQGKINYILDNLIHEGKVKPCIVVMNNGMVQVNRNGIRRIDANLLENLLIQDCIPFIEANYRVQADKWNRAVAGLSMGSKQASVIAFSHPELFAYVGIFSGFVFGFEIITNDLYKKIFENPEQVRENYRILFRACGEKDGLAMPVMENDGRILESLQLDENHWSGHSVHIYPGDHEWNVWRKAVRDFVQVIF